MKRQTLAIALALLLVSCDRIRDYADEWRHAMDPAGEVWPDGSPAQEKKQQPVAEPSPPKPQAGPAPVEPPADELRDRFVSDPSRIVFRFTDDEGNLTFVTGIDNVPPRYRSRVKVVDGSKLTTYSSTPPAARPSTPQRTQAAATLRGSPGGAWNSNQIDWVPLAQAKTRARRLEQPVMVVIYTSWCPHCKNYEKLFSDPEVALLAKQLVMVRGDSDEMPELGDYAPDGRYIPRTVFLSPTGRIDESINTGGNSKFNFHGDTPETLLWGMRTAVKKYGQ